MGLFDIVKAAGSFVGNTVNTVVNTVKTVSSTVGNAANNVIKTVETKTGVDLPGGYTREELNVRRRPSKSKPPQKRPTTARTTTTRTATTTQLSQQSASGSARATSNTSTGSGSTARSGSSGSKKSNTSAGTKKKKSSNTKSNRSYVPQNPLKTWGEATVSPSSDWRALVEAKTGEEAYDVVMVGDSGYYDLEKQMSVVGRPTASNVRVVGVIDPNTREYKSAAGVVDDVDEAKALYGALTTAMSQDKALQTAAETAAKSAAVKRVSKGKYTEDDMRMALVASTGMRDGGLATVAIQQKTQQLNKTAQEIEQKSNVVNRMVSDLKQTEQKTYELHNQLDTSRQRITALENELKSVGVLRTQEEVEKYNKQYEQYTAEVQKYNALVKQYNTLVDEYKSKATQVRAEAKSLRQLRDQYWMDSEALKSFSIEATLSAAWGSGDRAAMKWLHESRPEVQLGRAKYELLSKIDNDPLKALAFEFSSSVLSRADPFGLKSKAEFVKTLAETGDYNKAREAYLTTKTKAYMEMKENMWQNNTLDIGKTAQYALTSPASFLAYGAVAGKLVGHGLTRLAALSPRSANVVGAGLTVGGIAYLGYDIHDTAKKEGLASAAAKAAEYAIYGAAAGVGAKEGVKLARAQIYKEMLRSPKKITVVGSNGAYNPKTGTVDVTTGVGVKITGGKYAGKTFGGKYNLHIANVDELGTYYVISQQGSQRARYIFTTTGKKEYAEALRLLGLSGGSSGSGYTLQLAAGSRLSETMVTPHDTSLKTRIIPTLSKFQELSVARKDVSATFGRAKVYIPNEMKVNTTYLVTKSGPSINVVSHGRRDVDTIVTMIHAKELADVGKIGIVKTAPSSGGTGISSAFSGSGKDTPKIFLPPRSPAVNPSTISNLKQVVTPKGDGLSGNASQVVRSSTNHVSSLPAVGEQLATNLIASGVERIAPKTVLLPPAPKILVEPKSKQGKKTKEQFDVSDVEALKIPSAGAVATVSVKDVLGIEKKEQITRMLPRLEHKIFPRVRSEHGTMETKTTVGKTQLKGTSVSIGEVQAVTPKTTTKSQTVELKLVNMIPSLTAPPLLPSIFAPRVPRGAPLPTVRLKAPRGRIRLMRKAPRKSKRTGIPLWFVKPTLPTAHKMISKFGKVIVPRSPKVTTAYKRWLKRGGIGEFDPLKVVDFKDATTKDATAKGSKTARPKILQDADKRKKKKRWWIWY